MEHSETEVYLASNSYCKVGKVTSKRAIEEEQATAENNLEKENHKRYDALLRNTKI